MVTVEIIGVNLRLVFGFRVGLLRIELVFLRHQAKRLVGESVSKTTFLQSGIQEIRAELIWGSLGGKL